MVFDDDATAETRRVGEDRAVTHATIVGHVRIDHEQIAVTDPRHHATDFGSGTDRGELAEDVPGADLQSTRLTAVLEVLRQRPDAGKL